MYLCKSIFAFFLQSFNCNTSDHCLPKRKFTPLFMRNSILFIFLLVFQFLVYFNYRRRCTFMLINQTRELSLNLNTQRTFMYLSRYVPAIPPAASPRDGGESLWESLQHTWRQAIQVVALLHQEEVHGQVPPGPYCLRL